MSQKIQGESRGMFVGSVFPETGKTGRKGGGWQAGIPPWERAASPYGNAALPPVLFLYAPAPFCAAPCAI